MTISTGFVVDDAIVVIENVTRYLEMGMQPLPAAFKGASEIGFTVISMSTSLVAVFIPILMMGGIVGRLFREFAVTLSTAIVVSLLVSLTTTPMMCAKFLRHDEGRHGWLYRLFEKAFDVMLSAYAFCLRWVLGHQPQVLFITILTVCLNVALFVKTPKGFFPQQDTGRLTGNITADQDTSFPAMDKKMRQLAKIVQDDPAVDSVNASTGGGGGGGNAINTARMFVQLKPLQERKMDVESVMNRLRVQLTKIPGAVLILQAVQDVRVGGRGSSAQFQYTIQSDHIEDLTKYAPLLLEKMSHLKLITDVTSDQQTHGLESLLAVDRDAASRMGVSMAAIDNTLNDAFGQRQVSNLYMPLNQYHVVLEVSPDYLTSPDALKSIYVPANNGAMVPLSAFAHYENNYSALQVNHQGQVPAITISFNMRQGPVFRRRHGRDPRH